MSISVNDIKQLREQTGAGMMDCKEALTESNGDFDKAVVFLRKKGLAGIRERDSKAATEGVIGNYIHTGGKIGVMVEINCETDFVAKSPDFHEFAKNVAMHIAASNPGWIKREDVPQDIVDREKEIILPSLAGKPENMLDKIMQGKLGKFYKEVCLMEQVYVKDPSMTVSDLLGEIASKVGEKIIITKFVRFAV